MKLHSFRRNPILSLALLISSTLPTPGSADETISPERMKAFLIARNSKAVIRPRIEKTLHLLQEFQNTLQDLKASVEHPDLALKVLDASEKLGDIVGALFLAAGSAKFRATNAGAGQIAAGISVQTLGRISQILQEQMAPPTVDYKDDLQGLIYSDRMEHFVKDFLQILNVLSTEAAAFDAEQRESLIAKLAGLDRELSEVVAAFTACLASYGRSKTE